LEEIVAEEALSGPREALLGALREEGLYWPLFVRELAPGRYELLIGEQSLTDARELGWDWLYAIVVPREAGPLTASELAILIDAQRETLGPLQKARHYQRLIDDGRYTQAELARHLGMKRWNLCAMLKVVRCPELVAAVAREGLTFSAAKHLATLSDGPRAGLLEELRRLKAEGGRFPSVREVEARVSALKDRKPPRHRAGLPEALPPELLPPELLPLVAAHLRSQGGSLRLVDAVDGPAEWSLGVPRAERERLTAMLQRIAEAPGT
jgi:ParB family chromosome partitioning protein